MTSVSGTDRVMVALPWAGESTFASVLTAVMYRFRFTGLLHSPHAMTEVSPCMATYTSGVRDTNGRAFGVHVPRKAETRVTWTPEAGSPC